MLASTMFLALLMTSAPAEEPIVLDLGTEPAAAEATVDFSSEDLQPTPDPGIQPMAICRLIPQCDSSADCVAICGTESAKCVHSKCPVRVCRC